MQPLRSTQYGHHGDGDGDEDGDSDGDLIIRLSDGFMFEVHL